MQVESDEKIADQSESVPMRTGPCVKPLGSGPSCPSLLFPQPQSVPSCFNARKQSDAATTFFQFESVPMRSAFVMTAMFAEFRSGRLPFSECSQERSCHRLPSDWTPTTWESVPAMSTQLDVPMNVPLHGTTM